MKKPSVHRRSAIFEATLVYVDEPQVITLLAQKTRVVAIAVAHADPSVSYFFATTVSDRDWQRYLSNQVDLRYLFTYATVGAHYTFDLQTMKDRKVMMTPSHDEPSEDVLPEPRFFATNHTHDYCTPEQSTDKETLFIDGEWELQDFGQFQQRYSDVYSFISATNVWNSANSSQDSKRRIQEAFLHRPFQGGFSYVHMFKDLNDNVPRSKQLNLGAIQYASPGHVDILGDDEIFDTLHDIIPHFLHHRGKIADAHNKFYKYLSDNRYLKMDGHAYGIGDPTERYMKTRASALAGLMLAPDFDAVWRLTNENALVASKVVLAFYRRLNDAAAYFAQGRVAYRD